MPPPSTEENHRAASEPPHYPECKGGDAAPLPSCRITKSIGGYDRCNTSVNAVPQQGTKGEAILEKLHHREHGQGRRTNVAPPRNQ